MKLSEKIRCYINPPEGEPRLAPPPGEVEKWAEGVERLETVAEAAKEFANAFGITGGGWRDVLQARLLREVLAALEEDNSAETPR